ncbi:hypothetical protein GCM10009564_42890 [Streptomyces thermogriseus]|jgi:hypothetical protein|uniref:Integral membrane protein n=2 Tax=Streptomyces TaxID=1883 RepID=A0ABN1T4A4_9ACTN
MIAFLPAPPPRSSGTQRRLAAEGVPLPGAATHHGELDMTVAWRSAASYALAVTLGSLLTGAAVGLFWSAWAGSLGSWTSFWIKNPWQLVFAAATTLTLTLIRRFTDPMPLWRVPLIDGGAYLGVLLLCAGVASWAAGSDTPVDEAFFVASLALLWLQLPSAWLLIFYRAHRLDIVLTRSETSSKAA